MCLFLATLEYLIPKPLPFFRLGLANLPILLALPLFSRHTASDRTHRRRGRGVQAAPWRDVLALILVKAIGQGIVNGTLASYVFLFSLAGSLASGIVMLLAYQVGGRHISLVGVSVTGALFSNIVQLALSIAFIFGSAAWRIAPLMLGVGTMTGLLTGILAAWFSRHSRWYLAVGEHAGA